MAIVCKIHVSLNEHPLLVAPWLAYELLQREVVTKRGVGEFAAVDYERFWTTMKDINR